jgi:hypothetical protein
MFSARQSLAISQAMWRLIGAPVAELAPPYGAPSGDDYEAPRPRAFAIAATSLFAVSAIRRRQSIAR